MKDMDTTNWNTLSDNGTLYDRSNIIKDTLEENTTFYGVS